MLRKALVSLGFSTVRHGVRMPNLNMVKRFNEQALLVDLFKRLRVNVVLDVGANVGDYAKHLRLSGFDGHIFSFEPIKRDFETIEKVSAGDGKWSAINYALGAEDTQRDFNIVTSSEGSIKSEGASTILSSFLTPTIDVNIAKVEKVELRRLDTILPDMLASAGVSDPRIYLKVDTQGFDLEVFRGAEGVLGDVVGAQCEMAVAPLYEGAPLYTEVLRYLEERGFSLMDLFTVNRTPFGGIETYDCIMARSHELR